MAFKKILVKFIERVHLKLFGHEMGPEMREFLTNLIWSFLSGSVAAVAVLGVNILAGRLMGPVEYGKYNLVLVISSYFLVPIYFGLDLASVRAIARAGDKKEASRSITSSLVFILFSSFVIISLAFIFRNFLAITFSASVALINITLAFTAFYVLKNMLDCYVKGLKLFKAQFGARLIEMAAVLVSFYLLFIAVENKGFISYVYVTIIGAVALLSFYVWRLKSFFNSFNLKSLLKQLSYGKFYALTAALSTVFVSLDKLFINKYLGEYDLGIYVAYFTASVTLVLQISQMFNNVFFPSIAKDMSKATYQKIDRLAFVGFLPILVFVFLIAFLLMKLFGSKYGVTFDILLVFGILGTVQILSTIYNSVILTFSKEVYRRYLIYNTVINILIVFIYAGLVSMRLFTIQTVALALTLNYALIVILQRGLIKKHFCDKV